MLFKTIRKNFENHKKDDLIQFCVIIYALKYDVKDLIDSF